MRRDLSVHPVGPASLPPAAFSRTLQACWALAFFLSASAFVACVDESGTKLDCSTDEASIGLCADLHSDKSSNLVDWACVRPECPDPNLVPELDDGCTTIAHATRQGAGPEHTCITAWAELPRTQVLVPGLYGFGNGVPTELPSDSIESNSAEMEILVFFAPTHLHLGQRFEARISTNYRHPTGIQQALMSMVGDRQGLIVNAQVRAAGISSSGLWNFDLAGTIGTDRNLIGGPHVLELALIDGAGKIGTPVRWSLQVIGPLPDGCPLVADCNARACGRDPVCGVECGTCQRNEACHVNGTCEPINPEACPLAAECGARVCGLDPVCGTPCGSGCGQGEQCSVMGECLPAMGTTGGWTTTNPNTDGSASATTDDTTGCVPECDGLSCGPDPLCGVSCGTCEGGSSCVDGICGVCIPDCKGRVCGKDPVCGTNCGVPCDAGQQCNDGVCVCQPECGEAKCGLDPICGTIDCGSCGAGEICDTGVCECEPSCMGNSCGLDPVCNSGNCGICSDGFSCNEGSCVADSCEKDCSGGRECGPDPICGQNCGVCPEGERCDSGICECASDCLDFECGPDPVCGTANCGTCDAGELCNSGKCEEIPCVPECAGLACGNDPTCNESCGQCGAEEVCELGQCVDTPCIPDCSGLECGADPVCGLECGPCSGRDYCSAGTCETPINAIMVSTGWDESCALLETGTVQCWGVRHDSVQQGRPHTISGLPSKIVSISSGNKSTCALSDIGEVYCWGLVEGGADMPPDKVTGLSGAAAEIGVGRVSACARIGGTIECWGKNEAGQLGNGSISMIGEVFPPSPVSIITNASTLDVMEDSVCAIDSGDVLCWGSNWVGQLGIGQIFDHDMPTPTAMKDLPSPAVFVSGRDHHSCVGVTGGVVYCTGSAFRGALAESSGEGTKTPVLADMLDGPMSALAIGTQFSCGIRTTGELQCWGRNQHGQLGRGVVDWKDSGPPNWPQTVEGLGSGVSQVDAGLRHACALRNGQVSCWGSNDYYQLGDGTGVDRPSPVAVIGLGQWP